MTTGEFDVQLPANKIIQADWTIYKIGSGLDRLLAVPDGSHWKAFQAMSYTAD